MPNTLLLAESGSTKTDWCLLKKNRDPLYFKTSGINPYMQSSAKILSILKDEISEGIADGTDVIYFYGAGVAGMEKEKEVSNALWDFFRVEKIEVRNDIMAAARSLCGNAPGIVCILGTGSNACYYNGTEVMDQFPSLGFIAGDEGSGNHMGKRVLQYYAYNTFDHELKLAFEQLFGKDIDVIIKKLYQEPMPNRYLASFVQLLKENRGHFMIENIIEDSLNDFFHYHIFKYRQSWNMPLYFTGSVAFEFRDVIEDLCAQYELDLGAIVKSPMEGLLRYHQAML